MKNLVGMSPFHTHLNNHLGSTSLTTDKNGVKTSEMRYKPWGEVRSWWTSALATTPAYKLADYTFTGQYSYMDDDLSTPATEGFGLMFYNARMYDPALGRFTSADTIIPNGVQGLDRYAYVNNSPINFTDPSGHAAWDEREGINTLDFVKTLTNNDSQLTEAWLSLWKTNSGNKLARNIVKTKTPIVWADLPVGANGETSSGCASHEGPCEIRINSYFKVTDQSGQPWDLPSETVTLDTNQVTITLAHEAFHLLYGATSAQNSRYEEYLAFHTEDIVRRELEVQGYDFTGITLLNFTDANPFSSAGLDAWLKINGLLGSYSKLQYYDYSHRDDVWWQR